jgi:type IV pilus assembly protein PilM
MKWLTTQQSKGQAIGLDMSSGMIRMIQLDLSDESLSVIAAEEMPLDPRLYENAETMQHEVAGILADMYSRGGFRGREVISCLPNDSVKIKSLRVDTAEPGEIELLMRNDVAGRLGLNADQDEIRYMIAGNVYQGDEIKNEVIFFGVPKKIIETHIALLEEARLVPVAVDAAPCAMFRSYKGTLRRQDDLKMVSVFIEVGRKCTYVVIGRGHEITFIKQIPIGTEQLNNEVVNRLGIGRDEAVMLRAKMRNPDDSAIDPATRQSVIDAMSVVIEDLAREVSLCFRYYSVTFRGEKPQEVFFAGDEVQEKSLMNSLCRHLGTEIKIAQPLRGFDVNRVNLQTDDPVQSCQWAVAVGLSMKGWQYAVCGVSE